MKETIKKRDTWKELFVTMTLNVIKTNSVVPTKIYLSSLFFLFP